MHVFKVRIVREKGDQSMTLTINTNVPSLIAQRNLQNATNSLNLSLERLTTGYKINRAGDNAAGYSIADIWDTQISSLDVATDNASTGADLLQTAEQNYSILSDHLQRIRDLTVQAANGTFGSTSLKAIQAEIYSRLQEINRVSSNSEFNGVKLMKYVDDPAQSAKNKGIGMTQYGIDVQVGLYNDNNSVINLGVELFKSAQVSSLFRGGEVTIYKRNSKGDIETETKTLDQVLTAAGGSVAALDTQDGLRAMAAACSALKYTPATTGEGTYTLLADTTYVGANAMIGFIDNAIEELSRRVTKIGASQNRIASAISAIDVQSQNLTSSLSTLRDTDVASESSKYIQSQILQQASATLLATANQSPSIALNLI